jgi:glycosyltransferase involved in cell wall biosynthesis
MPEVSIIIPTYNREDILPRAIDSVLDQTFSDFELIIVDDGSSDGTEGVIKSYSDDRLKYIRHRTNRGQNQARNTGIKSATGKYISYLDSDDEFLPAYLEEVVTVLNDSDDEVGGVFTAREAVRNGNVEQRDVIKGEIDVNDITTSWVHDIGSNTELTYKSSILDDIGLHDPEIVRITDVDFYMQILSEYKMIGVNKYLCRHHSSENNVSSDAELTIDGQRAFINKYKHELPHERVAKCRHQEGLAAVELGRMNDARKAFLKSIRNYPYKWFFYYHLLLSFTNKKVFNTLVPSNKKWS